MILDIAKRRFATFGVVLASSLAGLLGCSESNVAGNSAETGSPELAGVLYLDGGKPAAMARVQCVPSGYDSRKDSLPSAFVTTTDESGSYLLDSVPSGTYSLEAFEPESGKMLLLQGIEIPDSGKVAISDTLLSAGYFAVDLDDESLDGSVGSALVPGTTILRPFKVEGSLIVVDSLPAASMDLILYFDDGSEAYRFDVDVPAADTAVIRLEHDSAVVDTVIRRFVAPLAWPAGADTSMGTYSSDIPLAIRLDSANCDFEDFENLQGRWEAFRLSSDGTRSASLPISQSYFDIKEQRALFWVRVDSLNVTDSLELVFNTSKPSVYAQDVFPTSRMYTAVYHFDGDLETVADEAEKQNYVGTGVGLKATEGVLGQGALFDGESYMTVENSAATDSSRVSDLNYIGTNFFTFSLWVKLDDVKTSQTIFAKSDRQYDLRFVPDSGFVINFYHRAEAFKGGANDTSNYKLVKFGGADQVKAGEWVFVCISRGEKINMFVNDHKVEQVTVMLSWDGEAGTDYDFEVGRMNGGAGPSHYFKGSMDELFAAGSSRQDSWMLTTYLNQRPGSEWPKVIAK